METSPQPQPSSRPEQKEKIVLRILVAEDDPNLREFLVDILGHRYTSVESVEDGQLLLDKLSNPSFNVDFIITDENMPNLTGLEAIAKIRTIDRFKNLPIILHTSERGNEKAEAEALGAFFLRKPAMPDVLYSEIERMRSGQA